MIFLNIIKFSKKKIVNVIQVGLFCLFGVLRRFQHCTGHITTGSWKGRGNQYIEFARVVYCKLPTNGKQLPAFPLTAMTGIEPRLQRWEARVLPLCHRGPIIQVGNPCYIYTTFEIVLGNCVPMTVTTGYGNLTDLIWIICAAHNWWKHPQASSDCSWDGIVQLHGGQKEL